MQTYKNILYFYPIRNLITKNTYIMGLPIKGEAGILYVHDGALYRPIACLTSSSLNTALSIIESITKCNPGVVVKQAGTFSYTIDAEGEYIDTTSVGGDDTKASHDYLLQLQKLLLVLLHYQYSQCLQ